MSTTHHFDVLIIGSGLAGLTAALKLAPTHRVAVVTKRGISDGSSNWAQGGIAAVLAEGDSYASHVDDTLVAGAGLCDLEATRFTVENAPAAIAWLQELGVPFSTENGELHLTREGGHTHRRIVHATDATGAAVQTTLSKLARATPGITFFENHMLVDLITERQLPGRLASTEAKRCYGAYVLDVERDEVETYSASAHHPGHRRRGQGLPLHHQPRHRHRRRHRSRLARRLPRGQHGIHPVPPDLPVPPQRQELPHHRGRAR